MRVTRAQGPKRNPGVSNPRRSPYIMGQPTDPKVGTLEKSYKAGN
jgi:hypothetical protein